MKIYSLYRIKTPYDGICVLKIFHGKEYSFFGEYNTKKRAEEIAEKLRVPTEIIEKQI